MVGKILRLEPPLKNKYPSLPLLHYVSQSFVQFHVEPKQYDNSRKYSVSNVCHIEIQWNRIWSLFSLYNLGCNEQQVQSYFYFIKLFKKIYFHPWENTWCDCISSIYLSRKKLFVKITQIKCLLHFSYITYYFTQHIKYIHISGGLCLYSELIHVLDADYSTQALLIILFKYWSLSMVWR